MGRQRLHVRRQLLDGLLLLCNLLWELGHNLLLQAELLALMVGLHEPETAYLHFQRQLFLDTRVTRADGHNLTVGKGDFIHVVAGAGRGFRCDNLRNYPLFRLHRLPEIGVKRPLRHIAIDVDGLILIALPLDSTLALCQISGPPRAVSVVRGGQTRLDVHASAHHLSGTHKNTDLPGVYLCKQFLLFYLRIRVMDERNLFRRHPTGNQFSAYIIIDIKLWNFFGIPCAFGRFSAFWSGNITENQLGEFFRIALPPDTEDVLDTFVHLGSRFVRQGGVNDSLIQSQFPPVAGYLQHIVPRGVYRLGVDKSGPSGQVLHHFFLDFRGLAGADVVLHLRNREIQLVRRFDVGKQFD